MPLFLCCRYLGLFLPRLVSLVALPFGHQSVQAALLHSPVLTRHQVQCLRGFSFRVAQIVPLLLFRSLSAGSIRLVATVAFAESLLILAQLPPPLFFRPITCSWSNCRHHSTPPRILHQYQRRQRQLHPLSQHRPPLRTLLWSQHRRLPRLIATAVQLTGSLTLNVSAKAAMTGYPTQSVSHATSVINVKEA